MTDGDKRMSRRKRNFTLIELLITVSIIVILTGLLLPALNKAKEKARAIKCTGNLKQIGTSFGMYLTDYNDCYPSSLQGDSAWDGIKTTWVGAVGQYMGIKNGINTSGWPSLKKSSSFACPTLAAYMTGEASFAASDVHYGYNADLFGRNNYAVPMENGIPSYWGIPRTVGIPIKAGALKMPAQTLMTADSRFSNSAAGNCKGYYTFADDRSRVALRHSRRANVTYADLHVGMENIRGVIAHPSSLPWNCSGTPKVSSWSSSLVYVYSPF